MVQSTRADAAERELCFGCESLCCLCKTIRDCRPDSENIPRHLPRSFFVRRNQTQSIDHSLGTLPLLPGTVLYGFGEICLQVIGQRQIVEAVSHARYPDVLHVHYARDAPSGMLRNQFGFANICRVGSSRRNLARRVTYE